MAVTAWGGVANGRGSHRLRSGQMVHMQCKLVPVRVFGTCVYISVSFKSHHIHKTPALAFTHPHARSNRKKRALDHATKQSTCCSQHREKGVSGWMSYALGRRSMWCKSRVHSAASCRMRAQQRVWMRAALASILMGTRGHVPRVFTHARGKTGERQRQRTRW